MLKRKRRTSQEEHLAAPETDQDVEDRQSRQDEDVDDAFDEREAEEETHLELDR